jgi:hypothetical protein
VSEPLIHPLNFYAGWGMVLAAFISGAGIGLYFHRPDFWGGYASLRRRLARLGHIALAALGLMNVVFAISVPVSASNQLTTSAASWCFVAGGIAMPLACFLTAWREPFRRAFVVPVALLIAAVVLVLFGAIAS